MAPTASVQLESELVGSVNRNGCPDETGICTQELDINTDVPLPWKQRCEEDPYPRIPSKCEASERQYGQCLLMIV